MKEECLEVRGKALLESIKEWNVTIAFWIIMILVEVAINLLK
jgi:hypothetical protein